MSSSLFGGSVHRYQRGDVVYVPFTYAELTGGKTRPAVVVSTEEYQAEWGNLIVAAHTRKVTAHVLQESSSAGLRLPSVVTSNLFTLSPEVLGRKVGRLTDADLQGVESCLQKALGLG